MLGLNIFLIVCLFTISTLADDLPKWITPCPKSGPSTNECVKENIQKLLKVGVKGDPDRNVPSFDPLFVKRAITPDAVGAVSLKQDFKNFTYNGISKVEISQVKANFDNTCQIKMKYVQPQIIMEGTYAANGRLLLFQVKGSDKFDIVLNDMDTVATIDCEFYDKDNEKYFRIKNINFVIRPGSGHLNFPNLIQNNKEVSDTINDLLNENFQDIINEYSPTLLRGVEGAFKNAANQLLNNIPAKVLFKD